MSSWRLLGLLLIASAGIALQAQAGRPIPIHRSGMEQSTCPNGQIEDAEQCDDHNAINGDGCPTNCRLIQCGDGAKEPAEDCDDGSIDASNGCGGEFCEITTGWLCGPVDVGEPSSTSVCTPDCGDGLIVGGEQCDQSNLDGQNCQTLGFTSGNLACTAQCQFDTAACVTNSAPVAVDDNAATNEDQSLQISAASLLANDVDAEPDSLTIVSVTNPANGVVALAGDTIEFTPNAHVSGTASFEYVVSDGTASDVGHVTITVVPVADATYVFVQRAVLALAHGTGGTSVPFPIMSWLTDLDGSESLSLKIAGVPTGLSFNAGTNLGGGVWQFTPADLPNLTLNLPGSYTTSATNLTVQATATETSNGATASASLVATMKASYTTVDITTTESGSYTGSSANEFIQGGNGNNTLNGSSGNNIVNGNGGDDTLYAASGSDRIHGGSGADAIDAGSGTDVVAGGSGNDTLIGGGAGENFIDVFVWQLGDQNVPGSPYTDTIQNFSTAAAGSNTNGGDVLNLRGLLQGAQAGGDTIAGNLADYLHFEIVGGDTHIHISHTGGFAADSHSVGGSYSSNAETQTIVLAGVNLQSLYAGATTDTQLIVQLFNNNKLVTQ